MIKIARFFKAFFDEMFDYGYQQVVVIIAIFGCMIGCLIGISWSVGKIALLATGYNITGFMNTVNFGLSIIVTIAVATFIVYIAINLISLIIKSAIVAHEKTK